MVDKNKNKLKNNTNTIIDKGTCFLLFLAVVLVPLIVRIRIVPVGQYEYGIIRASSSINDMFSYNKAVAVCVLATILVLNLVVGRVLEEDRVKLNFKFLPSYLLYGYVGLCLLASICSPYKSIAFWGISERYEGFFVILSYGVLFMVSMAVAKAENMAKLLMGFFAISAVIIGIFAVFQIMDMDFFATTTGSKLVLGQYYAGENLSLKFESAYGTLYNPNCLGMYGGMLASLMFAPALVLPVKNKLKYLFGGAFVLAVICIVGSDSVGGLLGFGCGIAVELIMGIICFFAKKMYKNKIYLAGAIAAVVLAIAVPCGLLFTDTTVADKAQIILAALSGESSDETPFFYEDFTFDGNTASIVTKAGAIDITAEGDSVIVEQNGEVCRELSSRPMDNREGTVSVYELNGLAKGELQAYDDKLIFVLADNLGNETNFLMRKTEKGIVPLEKFGKDVDMENPVKSVGFEGIERLGSGRGYIWSRSIPLLLNNVIIGKGPDSFALQFPQQEVVAKLHYLGNPYIIVDKPHSIYLQTGINTGVLSLIVLVALAGLCVLQCCIKAVKENNNAFVTAARIACAGAVVAYMAAGATTDSVVSVAPLFWVMLGMGFGINLIKVGENENV